MAVLISDECFGCGVCESACPPGAIHQSPGFPVCYLVDPVICNDCMDCVDLCPVGGLGSDPAWAVCHGRGCPLASVRYEMWGCSEGVDRCESCGSPMWRNPGGHWLCPECTARLDGRRAGCPKFRRAGRMTPSPVSNCM